MYRCEDKILVFGFGTNWNMEGNAFLYVFCFDEELESNNATSLIHSRDVKWKTQKWRLNFLS